MGATTLYHPIPLSVIRGCAELGGFQFGKIKQLRANEENGTALYTATLQRVPPEVVFEDTWTTMQALKSCFLDDIQIVRTGYTINGILFCWISVHLKQDEGAGEEEN